MATLGETLNTAIWSGAQTLGQTQNATAWPAGGTLGAASSVATYAGGGVTVLWHADFEEGNLNDLYAPGTEAVPGGSEQGGEFNSNDAGSSADATISTVRAKTGTNSVRLRSTTVGSEQAGTRLFRWGTTPSENSGWLPAEFFASCWMWFTQQSAVGSGFWNIFQMKAKEFGNPSNNDSFWQLNIGNRAGGAMFLNLYNWVNSTNYSQAIADIPVAAWMHVEMYVLQSPNDTGRIRVWQDGVELWDRTNVTTTFPNPSIPSQYGNQWSVNNYRGAGFTGTEDIYVDDMKISAVRVGTG